MYKTAFKIALATLLALIISYDGTPKPTAAAQERPTTAKALLARKDTSQTVVLAGRVTDRAGKPLPGANIIIRSLNLGSATGLDGNYKLVIPSGFVRGQEVTLECKFIGYQTKTLTIVLAGGKLVRDFTLEAAIMELDAITVTQSKAAMPGRLLFKESNRRMGYSGVATFNSARADILRPPVRHNTEEYDKINDNQFLSPLVNPLSTFSIDVDAASYANVRRFLNQGQLPYKDAVRIEELINYFDYDYEDPTGEHPFSVTTEVSRAPWNPDHHLVHVGLQGKKLNYDEVRPSNLVFLVDVSGSMRSANKLDLLKKAFKLLVKNQPVHNSKLNLWIKT